MNKPDTVRGYSLQLASDVFERDGMGLELRAPNGRVVAEIFRDDTTGDCAFAAETRVHIPLPVVRWFLDQAREKL